MYKKPQKASKGISGLPHGKDIQAPFRPGADEAHLIDKRQMAELVGRIYIEEKILTAYQISELKKEIYKSEHFRVKSLWDFYNHCTHALKKSHPGQTILSHTRVHDFVMKLA